MMESLRKRVPFKVDADTDTAGKNTILDEQEQEEMIAELRGKAQSLDRRMFLQARAYATISCLAHVLFFFRPWLFDEPPIIFVRLFALIHILVHVNLMLHLTPTLNSVVHRVARETPYLPLPVLWSLGVSGLAPLVSLASGKSWQQTSWWSVSSVITLLVWTMLQSVQDSDEHLERLEKLRYDAKGA